MSLEQLQLSPDHLGRARPHHEDRQGFKHVAGVDHRPVLAPLLLAADVRIPRGSRHQRGEELLQGETVLGLVKFF